MLTPFEINTMYLCQVAPVYPPVIMRIEGMKHRDSVRYIPEYTISTHYIPEYRLTTTLNPDWHQVPLFSASAQVLIAILIFAEGVTSFQLEAADGPNRLIELCMVEARAEDRNFSATVLNGILHKYRDMPFNFPILINILSAKLFALAFVAGVKKWLVNREPDPSNLIPFVHPRHQVHKALHHVAANLPTFKNVANFAGVSRAFRDASVDVAKYSRRVKVQQFHTKSDTREYWCELSMIGRKYTTLVIRKLYASPTGQRMMSVTSVGLVGIRKLVTFEIIEMNETTVINPLWENFKVMSVPRLLIYKQVLSKAYYTQPDKDTQYSAMMMYRDRMFVRKLNKGNEAWRRRSAGLNESIREDPESAALSAHFFDSALLREELFLLLCPWVDFLQKSPTYIIP